MAGNTKASRRAVARFVEVAVIICFLGTLLVAAFQLLEQQL